MSKSSVSAPARPGPNSALFLVRPFPGRSAAAEGNRPGAIGKSLIFTWYFERSHSQPPRRSRRPSARRAGAVIAVSHFVEL